MSPAQAFFFNDREGHTVLSEKERRGLKLSYITSLYELDQAEQLNISKGLLWLSTQVDKNILTEKFFLTLHNKLFSDVWKWAGKYRTSEKNIGVAPWEVPVEMKKFLEDVRFWVEESGFDSWAEFLAHFHHRLVFIHPFPNGNGRFSRIVTGVLARKLKKPRPHWYSHLAPELRRNMYISALRSADERKYTPLIQFFEQGLSTN